LSPSCDNTNQENEPVVNTTNVQGDGPSARCACMLQIVFWSMTSRKVQLMLILLTMAIGSLGLAATYFIGLSAQKQLWADLDMLMGNHVRVYSYTGPDDILLQYRPTAKLTLGDLDYVRQHVKEARYVEPMLITRERVEHNNKRMIMMIDGISPKLENEPSYQPVQGERLSKAAHDGIVFECHLTTAAAEYLSINMEEEPAIRIGSHRFRVRGITANPVEADPPYQLRVTIPYLTARTLLGDREDIGVMLVSWYSSHNMESMVSALRLALNECRAPNAYVLSSSQFTLKKRKNIISNFMLFGILQATFCILVASIGIVNVMLANVVRRAREFAIRVAVGAQYKDLALIVLIESVLLGIFGALIGIIGAVFLSPVLCKIFASKVEEASQLHPHFCIEGAIVSLVVCGLCGLMAGIVPAIKARKLDILAVLRAE
jgi:ABC-type lipoprotein release transport system permease subunit